MMAFERSPSARLEPETLDALRHVMDRAVRRGNHADELHDVLCRASAEARAKGMQAEQLLIVMKELWHSLPDLRGTDAGEQHMLLLQELISRCIDQYYAG